MSRSNRAASAAFSPTVILVVLLVGMVSLAGIGVLSAYAPELKSGNDGGTHALSRSSVGFGGLTVLLRNLGAPVLLNRGVLTETSDESLLVLTPRPDTKPEQIKDIKHYGATLVVLPKWNAAPDPNHPGWVRTAGLIPAEAALSPLNADLRKTSKLTTRSDRARLVLRRPNGSALGAPVETMQLRTLEGPDWIPVVIDDQGRSVLAMDRKSRIYVLADPDLISNGGLKTLAGARTARDLIAIVRPSGAPVVFDLTLNGFQRSRNLLRLMLEPPLLGLTLVLAALAALAGFHAAVRFGAPKDRSRIIALGKRGLADNTAGLVRLARREPHMAVPYAQIMRAAVARAIGAPRALDDAALDAFLDRVGRTVGAQHAYSALVEQARAAKTPGDLIKVAAALYRWNQEMTRGRQ
ncbi:DUF4350 domain-containing protein [Brevundimonas sp. SORGH_AS_0993]|uniref:DUF4350 domain-containing protein n=1 Tax=Brevundimonas sp. SORGH_AS_0993 TaxID=3041794 RepID=UPI00277E4390|nr:DUF4350 domain-containing protein [Brevundimonas sp. SORGH_AS_0993]MDQ1155670.1 hypothetical protein [Brevundimonas sp. SORGH_AS_0993]